METLRLHIKYSSGTVSFEFECEGPVDQVLEQAKESQKTVSVSPRMQLPATANLRGDPEIRWWSS